MTSNTNPKDKLFRNKFSVNVKIVYKENLKLPEGPKVSEKMEKHILCFDYEDWVSEMSVFSKLISKFNTVPQKYQRDFLFF